MISFRTVFVVLLYLALIGVIINSFIVWYQEPTTFETEDLENEAFYPSFTLCGVPFDNDTFESFEDVTAAINEVKDNFKAYAYYYVAYQIKYEFPP